MKNLRRALSLLLALCMVFSLASFASAEETVSYSGTVGDSQVCWSLDRDTGKLVISGFGDTEPFQSKDDQPWADVRDQIKEVWFSDMGDLAITDLAYWFADCTALTQAEIPYTTSAVGTDAFAGCSALEKIIFYYMDGDVFQIEQGAFHADGAGETAVYLLSEQTDVVSRITEYGWTADHRGEVIFYDVYTTEKFAASVSNSGYFSNYYCDTCGGSLFITHDLQDNGSGRHARYWACGNSSCDRYYYGSATTETGAPLGTWQYMLIDNHVYNSTGTCMYCGYYDASQAACSHGSYSYNYVYYSNSYHTYDQTCNYCSEVLSSTLQSHNTTYSCTYNNASTHTYSYTCYQCWYVISSGTEAHNWSAAYSQYSSTQHKVTQTCSGCSHSTKSYAAHSDSNGDGQCDACGYSLSATLTWDLGDGSTVTTTQSYGANLVLPTEPTWEGYTFLGWFTASSGGAEVTANTVFNSGSPTTYYAQWEQLEVFSVTVPAVLPLAVSANGEVYCTEAAIENLSSSDVKVTGITVTAQSGWTLVPYANNMARAKVDAKQIGFAINGVISTTTGDGEELTLSGDWSIAKDSSLALDYDAVVSALSGTVTDEAVLSVEFVFAWA